MMKHASIANLAPNAARLIVTPAGSIESKSDYQPGTLNTHIRYRPEVDVPQM
ncbi:MAG: hypothetical protein GWN67_19985 [Phycisphaerae bacterium]|nr:hypothetical protein [Phycisphaerae bacterium]NIS53254.1 hypothetical protein [Phycisphaerae bacterium]NIU10780.1 hypothetical protein [Phycisphaerae bacterium]NIU58575.1 hypothetical protein [Phycisphaerae bacterium]NIV01783.1 hypothetical protein [Phycisphaerae bacterium]